MAKYLLPVFLVFVVVLIGLLFMTTFRPTGKQIALPSPGLEETEPSPEEPKELEDPAETPQETTQTEIPQAAFEGILASWPFDSKIDPETNELKGDILGNSVRDISGNANHGFLQDGAELTVPEDAVNKISENAISAQALTFDGKDDSVSIPYKKTLDSTKGLTISAWMNLRTREGVPFKTIIKRLASTDSVPAIYSLNLDSKNKNMIFSISADKKDTFIYVSSKTEIPIKEWVFVAGVWDKKKIKLFVDGVLVDEKEAADIFEIGVNTHPLFIGSSETAGANNFDGQIDEVQIANYAISDENILQMYHQYRPEEVPPALYEPIGLLAKISLDGILEDELKDVTENGHDGLTEGAVDIVEGAANNALHFDNSYLTIPLSEPIKTAPEISVSIWVKLDSGHEGGTLFEARPEKEPSTPAGLSLKISELGELTLSKGSSPKKETTVAGPTITPDEWHHIVGEFTGKELRLYVDGILAEPSAEDAKKIDWANDLPTEKTIPAHFSIAAATMVDGSFGSFLKTSVDDIQIYDAILSQLNVEYLYNNPGEIIG